MKSSSMLLRVFVNLLILCITVFLMNCTEDGPTGTGPSATIRNRSDFRVTVTITPSNQTFQLDPGKNKTVNISDLGEFISVVFPDGRRFTGFIDEFDRITIRNDSVSK